MSFEHEDGTHLSAEEITQLKTLIPVAEHLKAEAEYRMAVKLVLSSWKKTIIALAGVLAALIVLREHVHSIGRALAAFWRGLVG